MRIGPKWQSILSFVALNMILSVTLRLSNIRVQTSEGKTFIKQFLWNQRKPAFVCLFFYIRPSQKRVYSIGSGGFHRTHKAYH